MTNIITITDFCARKFVKKHLSLDKFYDLIVVQNGVLYGRNLDEKREQIGYAHTDTTFDIATIYCGIYFCDKNHENGQFITLRISENGRRTWTAGSFDEIKL